MRKLTLAMAVALIAAACSSGSGSDVQTSDSASSSPGVSDQAAGNGSDFCNQARSMANNLDALNTDDPNADPVDMFQLAVQVYKQMQASAPGELQGDIVVVIDTAEKYAEWAKDPTGTPPIDEATGTAFEDASTRIGDYLQDECGIDSGAETAVDTADPATASDGSPNVGTHVISIDGETFTETLSGTWEVSCDLNGDLESGSIDIYLDGLDFSTSVASYDSGIKPGSYEGQIWVLPSDDSIDEQLLGLQEVDGSFNLDRTEVQPDGRWLFAGSFSASSDDPPASLEATFTCVGPVDS